jgi:hypothetical protein
MKNLTIFCLLAVLFSDNSPIARIVDLYQLEAQDLEI